MKNLLSLKGAHQLRKIEQKSIKGGGFAAKGNCRLTGGCPSGYRCCENSNGGFNCVVITPGSNDNHCL